MVFVVVGIVAYLIGLIASIPATFLVDQSANVRVGGTIWNGRAVVGSSVRVEWRFAPITSLANVAMAADWRASGGGTDLIGTAAWQGRQTVLSQVTGQADGTLLAAFAPRLPIVCRFTADVAITRLVIGGSGQEAEGRVTTGPLSCAARDVAAPPVELAPLAGQVAPTVRGASSGALMIAASRETLVELRLSRDGMLSIWPTAMAVNRAPFLAGQRYDTRVE